MRTIYSLDATALEADLILTIGSFDGVHRGHQYLLQQLVQRARDTKRLSAALTFHPHPRVVLQPEVRPVYLSTPEERAAILESLGLDMLVVLAFTRQLADTPAEAFIANLHTKLRMRELWVGPDFALGRGRSGNMAALQALAQRLGYELRIISPLLEGNEPISSTRIRLLLSGGKVDETARLLGRPYTLSGQVSQGARRGRTLGFRTANLHLDPTRAMPANGVYAVWALLRGDGASGLPRHYPAVANVGVRPSFDAGERLLEVHLLDYEGDLYGKDLAIQFIQWLRAERRFEDAANLVQQIQQDIATARTVLGLWTSADERGGRL